VGCDGWGSRLTIYIANSTIIIDHHRSPTLREAIDFSITSHFQITSTDQNPHPSILATPVVGPPLWTLDTALSLLKTDPIPGYQNRFSTQRLTRANSDSAHATEKEKI